MIEGDTKPTVFSFNACSQEELRFLKNAVYNCQRAQSNQSDYDARKSIVNYLDENIKAGDDKKLKLLEQIGSDLQSFHAYENLGTLISTACAVVNLLQGRTVIPNAIVPFDKSSSNKKGTTPRRESMNGGNTNRTEQSLNNGAEFNNNSDNRQPLIKEAKSEPRTIVQFFDEGSKSTAVDYKQLTALRRAVKTGNAPEVTALVKNGINPNSCIKNKKTIIQYAFENGKNEVVRALLELGANPNEKNSKGYTILMHLVEDTMWKMSNKISVRWLLDIGEHGRKQMIQTLIDGDADLDVQNEDGDTSLMLAVKKNDEEIVSALIQKGAAINMINKKGSNALSEAAENWQWHPQIIEYLLDHGADHTIKMRWGRTLLHMAAWHGNKKICKLLLKRGVSVDEKDDDGYTALLCAMQSDDENYQEVVRLLLKKNAHVNEQNNAGDTALVIACQRTPLPKLVKMLLERNANPNLPGKRLLTPFYHAASENHKKVVKLLLKHGATIQSDAQYFISKNNAISEIIKKHLEKSKEMNNILSDL